MLRELSEPYKPRRIRFPGIVKHAETLGVSRIHLYYVLTGVRRSPRIERYMAEQKDRMP